MPRYVILEHDWPTLHWDVFLQCGDVLKAWKVHQRPAPGGQLVAEINQDHRLIYLHYEGPVSGGRGTVRRLDFGEYTTTPNGYILHSAMQPWKAELTLVEQKWSLTIEQSMIES